MGFSSCANPLWGGTSQSAASSAPASIKSVFLMCSSVGMMRRMYPHEGGSDSAFLPIFCLFLFFEDKSSPLWHRETRTGSGKPVAFSLKRGK